MQVGASESESGVETLSNFADLTKVTPRNAPPTSGNMKGHFVSGSVTILIPRLSAILLTVACSRRLQSFPCQMIV